MYELGKKLSRDFFLRDAVDVARGLLGMHIVHEIDNRIIVMEAAEAEAYAGIKDKACHAYNGRRTSRTETFYKLGGHGYVYLIYGTYHMFNVVTGAKSDPSAVLVRMGNIVEGHDDISIRRFGKEYGRLSNARKRQLLNGPGKICRGLGIDMGHNGCDLLNGSLFIAQPFQIPEFEIEIGKRINIDYAGEAVDYPYRFTMVRRK